MFESQAPKRVAIAIELHWNLPWHLDCFQGIIDYGNDLGWACVTDPYLTGAVGDNDLSQYDGVIGRIDKRMAERVNAIGLPGVTLLYGADLHSVRSDANSCAQLAAEHLVACGYRQLGYIGDTPNPAGVSRMVYEVFRQRVTTLGCPPPIHTNLDPDDFGDPKRSVPARKFLAEWISKLAKPIGLYIRHMATARYLTQICVQLGLRVPEDVGILVHTVDKYTATSITPTLSEVAIDHWEQGQQAASVLNRLMQGEFVEPKTRYITSPRIITRESSDRFISEDELVSKAMRYIAEHVRQAVSAEDIAAALEVSRRTLDRRFEEVVGKTLSQEIVRRRILDIEGMLVESDLTMASIGELFGFGSASQFTQFYKKHAGITPTAFRKRQQRND
jgi:LacI family transcriptional regulator